MKLSKKLSLPSNRKRENRKVGFKRVSFEWKRSRQHINGNWKKERKGLGTINAFRRGTRADYIYNGSFHEAVRPVLVMAEIFSVMPVMNVTAKSPTDLYYSWTSIRNFYSITVMLLTFAFTVPIVMVCLSQRLQFDAVVGVVFYVSNCIARVFFMSLAMKWPELMQQWQKIEQKIPIFESQRDKSVLAYKIKMISLVVMLLSMSEHLLSIISTAFYSIKCTKEKTNASEDYFRIELNELFAYLEYSPFLAVFGKILNLLSTFLWTYMDLFIMVVSVGLSTQFRKINRHLMKYKGQAMPENYWIEIRSSYRNMCKLCETVDEAIGGITIVSFANNLFFVCVQLMKSLNPMPSFAHSVYFWFSLTFLITRTCAVSLYTADVNNESKKPIRALRSCPAESWCTEVKRFYYEVTKDVVALSGIRFFYLTRGLLLSIAGTIITYELVLIQFHKIDYERPSGSCAIIFYSVCLFSDLFFIRIAIHWPSLIQLWRRNEDVFLKLPYRRWKLSLSLELRALTLTVMAVAMLEHILYMSSVLYNNSKQIDECHLNISFFKNLYFREKKHLAMAIPYNGIAAIFFFINNVGMTLRWSFMDVFIMALSIGIARRYKQINERLETARGKLMPESFWIEIRTHFLAMTELLQLIDEEVSLLTLISCANNLYFICFQLFNSFTHIPLLINKVYFWAALIFITLRTLVMLFCASSINDASKKPLRVLRCVPSVAWSLEVQRFTDQLNNEVVALSGKRFFFITRKLILAIAGTVATYELVLLDTIKDGTKEPNLCDLRSITDIISGGDNYYFVYDGSFHEAIGSVLVLAQFFAIMPVQGIKGKSAKDLRFIWKSFRTSYSFFVFVMICLNAVCASFWLMNERITFIRIVPLVFYVSNAYAMICFTKMAINWPELMQSWENVEKNILMLTKPIADNGKLANKIRIISTVVLITSLCEHLMSIASELTKQDTCRSINDPLKRLIVGQLPHVFACIKYDIFKGLCAKTVNLLATFMWSYTDLFVMILSVGLSSLFKRINESLIANKEMTENLWTQHRQAYRKLCTLCELVDNNISKITLVSFSNNLYFICVQLLWSLNPMPNITVALYFWFSFVFLVSRTLAVTLYSAEINDQSKEPLKVIRNVPREAWCLEIKRFSNEITRDTVALSGMKFFFLTRGVVLSVAATIVTYELVLIQFHEENTMYATNQC
ncbi:uncharacterized protein LOC119082852 [Bradysia coprophila]|uniref:uncharacterized protein LOC119082852 n=1 Tax=Bradysia coprophila TaxID=38358 RepID=UPI00187D9265|nr:uncharacterized protein LOC119082852 [Bradysia coprophila]